MVGWCWKICESGIVLTCLNRTYESRSQKRKKLLGKPLDWLMRFTSLPGAPYL